MGDDETPSPEANRLLSASSSDEDFVMEETKEAYNSEEDDYDMDDSMFEDDVSFNHFN